LLGSDLQRPIDEKVDEIPADWVAKTDLTPVPSDKSAIQPVTPSQIYAWEEIGPDGDLTQYVEARMLSEQKWYALTGRVVDAKVEADGTFTSRW